VLACFGSLSGAAGYNCSTSRLEGRKCKGRPYGKYCAPLARSGKTGNSEDRERRLGCVQAMSGNDCIWPIAVIACWPAAQLESTTR